MTMACSCRRFSPQLMAEASSGLCRAEENVAIKHKGRRIPEGSVCKPCWELKYCPYGPLVEFFPSHNPEAASVDIQNVHGTALTELMSGALHSEEEVWDAVERFLFSDPANWESIKEYDPDEVGCRIYGHVCPVFFTQSGATETKAARAEGRSIPRDVMLKVVRRDDHVCQECYEYVPDDQLEFDHIIPLARGGPTSVGNLRLLCRRCNRGKSDRVDSLLIE